MTDIVKEVQASVEGLEGKVSAFIADSAKQVAEPSANRMRVEVQANTTTGSDVTVAPDRMPGVNPGAFRNLRISDVIPSGSTSSNSIA